MKNKSNESDTYYVGKEELKNELLKYKETKIVSEELGSMLLKIAKKFSMRPNFKKYSYREEFVSNAVFRMLEQLDKLDLNHPKCNPFAYLTQMCYYKFIEKISKENKFQNLKTKLKNHYYTEFEHLEDIKNSEFDDIDE